MSIRKQLKVNGSMCPKSKILSCVCQDCGKFFDRQKGNVHRGITTYCNNSCRAKKQTIAYARGTRVAVFGKKQKYKGVQFDSTWEVLLAKRLDELGIYWVRGVVVPWYSDDGKENKYYPDFYLPEYEIALEPKCKYFLTNNKKQAQKHAYILKNYPNVKFLFSEESCKTYTL